MTLPSVDDLRSQAEDALLRCGVDLDAIAGDRPVNSPVNGQPLAAVRWQDAGDVDVAVARAGERTTSLPVPRDVRPQGRSAWTGRARIAQSVRSLAWAARRRG